MRRRTLAIVLSGLATSCGDGGTSAAPASKTTSTPAAETATAAAPPGSPPSRRPAPTGRPDPASLPRLSLHKGRAAFMSRGCTSVDWSGQKRTDRLEEGSGIELRCDMPDGSKDEVLVARSQHEVVRDMTREALPGAVFVEHQDALAGARVTRNGSVDEAASKVLLDTVLLAAAGEEPYVVVQPKGTTWLRPKVERTAEHLQIAPALVDQVVVALQRAGHPSAMKLGEVKRSLDAGSMAVAPAVLVGTIEGPAIEVEIACWAEGEGQPRKPDDAAIGQAIFLVDRCWVTAEVGKDEASDEKKAGALLAALVDGPPPTP